MKRIFLIAVSLLVVTICLAGETEHGIYYNDGTFHKGSPQLHKPLLKGRYFTLNNSMIVPIDSVRAFVDSKGYNLIYKNSYDQYDFATRVSEGKISLYNNKKFFTAGNDKLYKLDYSNLSPILENHPKSTINLNKYVACKVVSYAAIATLIIGAVVINQRSNENYKPGEHDNILWGGLIAGSLAFGTATAAPKYLQLAVEEYNKTP